MSEENPLASRSLPIASVGAALLQSYREQGAVNTRDHNLPSRRAVSGIVARVEELVFPGFSRDEALDADTLAYATNHKLCQLAHDVSEQIAKNLVFDARNAGRGVDRASIRDDAMARTAHFLESLPAIRDTLLLDVGALYDGDPAVQSRDEIILAYPGLHAVLVHRVAHHFWNTGTKLIARIMSEDVHGKTGIDIHPGATIGKHFYIDHGTGVVVGETTVIGDHVKLYQGVSLGALSVSRRKQGKKRHPTLEDHVTIYAGATILGGDTVVGHHSIIGGNVWLIRSVAPNSIVENDPLIRIRNKDGVNSSNSSWEI
jgi:serine O-acetyltransferase